MNALMIKAVAIGASVLGLLLWANWYRIHLIHEGVSHELSVIDQSTTQWELALQALNDKHDSELKDLNDAHAKELQSIADYYSSHAVHHIMLCPAAVSKGSVPEGGSAGTDTVTGSAVLQQDVQLHPDIGPALDLLIKDADTTLANCRQAVGVDSINLSK